MATVPEGLTDAQREAATHPDSPLLVRGGPGTGKTRALRARFTRLVGDGTAPESIVVLAATPVAASRLSAALEDELGRGWGELATHTAPMFSAALLHAEAALDPFAVAASRADRLAVLLAHIDDLPLRHHDLGSRPAEVLGSIIARIDRLKANRRTAGDYAAWARGLQDLAARARESELAAIYGAHDALLAEAGLLDDGDLVAAATRLLDDRPPVRERFSAALVDDYHELTPAVDALLRALGEDRLSAFGGDGLAVSPLRAPGAPGALDALAARHPGAAVVHLRRAWRAPRRVLRAAGAVLGDAPDPDVGEREGEVTCWRTPGEHAQARAVAADVERLVVRERCDPVDVLVLVDSVRHDGAAVAAALQARALPCRLVGPGALFDQSAVRDALAWLRLLRDPADAGAVARALARPPIKLGSAELARVTQLARRRKLDLVAALPLALESPAVPPEGRERVHRFLALHRAALQGFDTLRPDLYVDQLVERLGLRRELLLSASGEVAARLAGLGRLAELAGAYARRAPRGSPRAFARWIAAVAEAGLDAEEAGAPPGPRALIIASLDAARDLEADHVYLLGLDARALPGRRPGSAEDGLLAPAGTDLDAVHAARAGRRLGVAIARARRRVVLSYAVRDVAQTPRAPSALAEAAREAAGCSWQTPVEDPLTAGEGLHAAFRALREEVLDDVGRVARRLGELRFDTELDVSHAVARYLELLKVAALIDRASDAGAEEALAELNARLARAATAEQREILETSPLDERLRDTERHDALLADARAARAESSLAPFLPRRGDGLALSASDIETYRACPLRYKFARVLRLPSEPTLGQRFGILIHQVLERYHAEGQEAGADLQRLLDAGWRRGGFGDSEPERQLRVKARAALQRYGARFAAQAAEPVFFERAFSFRLHGNLVRGRVDRVDQLADGAYELIDYKTGRPRSAAALREDVQLSLYALGAREAWRIDAPRLAYHYVLDDCKVPVPAEAADGAWVTGVVCEVAEGIAAQAFEPTPSFQTCSACEYRIACPAVER